MKKILTLCIVEDHPRILLGLKKRGFGAGRWNGFGGKVEAGETVEDAARRELFEEVGINISTLEKRGLIEFEFTNDPMMLEVHVFHGKGLLGDPLETEEMKPEWFHTDKIPYDTMWPDDEHWLPVFLAGKKFKAKFKFEGGEKEARVIDSDVKILESF